MLRVRVGPGFFQRQVLKRLNQRAVKRALWRGVTAGSQTFNNGARKRIHQSTKVARAVSGLLRKSMGYKVKTYRQSGTVVGIIGPRKGYRVILAGGTRVDPIKYAHIEERGRGTVRPKNKRALATSTEGQFQRIIGKHARPYSGRHFLGRTFAADQGQARRALRWAIWKSILKDVRRK